MSFVFKPEICRFFLLPFKVAPFAAIGVERSIFRLSVCLSIYKFQQWRLLTIFLSSRRTSRCISCRVKRSIDETDRVRFKSYLKVNFFRKQHPNGLHHDNKEVSESNHVSECIGVIFGSHLKKCCTVTSQSCDHDNNEQKNLEKWRFLSKYIILCQSLKSRASRARLMSNLFKVQQRCHQSGCLLNFSLHTKLPK